MTYHVQFLLLVLAGWVNRQQQDVIDYLQEENRVLRAGLRGKRLSLSDDERRRLAVKARPRVLPQSSVGGRRVTCSCARVSPDFERRSSFVDAGWAEFWHRTGWPSCRGRLDSNGTARVGGGPRGVTEIVRSLESTK